MGAEEQGRKWLKLWTQVLERVAKTEGKCFVLAKSTGPDQYKLEGGAQEGEVMVFDPSFKHETFNPTTRDRIILNIDIFHPELTDLECEVIQETIRLKKEMFGSTEEEVHPDRQPGR